MSEIKCPVDLNQFILEHPFENTFKDYDCEVAQAYGDCFHCFASAIAKRDRAIRESARQKGEWIEMSDFCGQPVCSVCNKRANVGLKRDHIYDTPKFCPNCGALMVGDSENEHNE